MCKPQSLQHAYLFVKKENPQKEFLSTFLDSVIQSSKRRVILVDLLTFYMIRLRVEVCQGKLTKPHVRSVTVKTCKTSTKTECRFQSFVTRFCKEGLRVSPNFVCGLTRLIWERDTFEIFPPFLYQIGLEFDIVLSVSSSLYLVLGLSFLPWV